jgi:hypothetical protein
MSGMNAPHCGRGTSRSSRSTSTRIWAKSYEAHSLEPRPSFGQRVFQLCALFRRAAMNTPIVQEVVPIELLLIIRR